MVADVVDPLGCNFDSVFESRSLQIACYARCNVVLTEEVMR
jgi:hypothetical protein